MSIQDFMRNKNIILIMTQIILFLLIGLTACNINLVQYKTDAKAEITNHLATMKKEEYTAENWKLILQFADEGKVKVDNAKTKAAIDKAKSSTIIKINGILSKEEDIKLQARQTYLEKILKVRNQAATIDDVSFFQNMFLGIYNDSLVAVFYGGRYHGVFFDVEESIEIAGVIFAWSQGYPILVWNQGEIYDLAEAFKQNLLTKENIIVIHELYNFRG